MPATSLAFGFTTTCFFCKQTFDYEHSVAMNSAGKNPVDSCRDCAVIGLLTSGVHIDEAVSMIEDIPTPAGRSWIVQQQLDAHAKQSLRKPERFRWLATQARR